MSGYWVMRSKVPGFIFAKLIINIGPVCLMWPFFSLLYESTVLFSHTGSSQYCLKGWVAAMAAKGKVCVHVCMRMCASQH